MRMWMVPPPLMCDKHLLGEHGELHKFLHSWTKQHSIAGRIVGNAMEPLSYKSRHDALASEMLSRGFRHQSPLDQPDFSYLPQPHLNYRVNIKGSLFDLIQRCPLCRERMKKMFIDDDVYGMMGLAEALSQISEPTNLYEDETMATKKPAVETPADIKKPAKSKAEKPAAEMVTLSDLAHEMGKPPSALRQKLRSDESIAKPEGRWAWKAGSKELAAVRKALGI